MEKAGPDVCAADLQQELAESAITMTELAGFAAWSPWVPFADSVDAAPRTPGVYLARRRNGQLVYVGMAGERRGMGIRGRLHVYATGKAAVSGLGEAAFNRALADPEFVRARLAELDACHPAPAQAWARAALNHADLEVCWASTPDRRSALDLEQQVATRARGRGLWNIR